DVVLDAYAVVQVPSSAQAKVRERGELAERLREQQDALDAANVHAEEIERELSQARSELTEAQAALGRERERANQRIAVAIAEQDALQRKLADAEEQLASSRKALEA